MRIQPEKFELEKTSVWSFPERGKWATHSGKFRGNWSPHIPRNILLRYSHEGDIVLDPMVGSGTSLIECKLTKRKGIGVDINPDFIELARKNLVFETTEKLPSQKLKMGDARTLSFLEDKSIDLILLHPPYTNVIKYSRGKIKEDLSNIYSIDKFCNEIEKVAREMYRVLKPNKYCAVLIGDVRRHRHYVPLAFRVMQRFLRAGFILKEDIIKHQWNTKTEVYWREKSKKYNFLLIMHEHLFVFRKSDEKEKTYKFKNSKL